MLHRRAPTPRLERAVNPRACSSEKGRAWKRVSVLSRRKTCGCEGGWLVERKNGGCCDLSGSSGRPGTPEMSGIVASFISILRAERARDRV
eukprot:2200928-Rhodomonas_salina.1